MSVLDDIIVGVREDLHDRQRAVPEHALQELIGLAPAPRDPLPAFREPHLSVIAEVKRRSPSKGDLAQIADPAALAAEYAAGGADAISVLTERRRFGGSLDDLRAVRAAVDTPVLRKDFIVSRYQLLEARAAGADLVLLIVAALDDAEMADLFATATGLGMTPLIEVHEAPEIDRAMRLDPPLVGVNARNLKTLDVDPAAFSRLAPLLPDTVVRVAESGIGGPADARARTDEGAQVVLVGESLVRTDDPRAAVATMRALTANRSLR